MHKASGIFFLVIFISVFLQIYGKRGGGHGGGGHGHGHGGGGHGHGGGSSHGGGTSHGGSSGHGSTGSTHESGGSDHGTGSNGHTSGSNNDGGNYDSKSGSHHNPHNHDSTSNGHHGFSSNETDSESDSNNVSRYKTTISFEEFDETTTKSTTRRPFKIKKPKVNMPSIGQEQFKISEFRIQGLNPLRNNTVRMIEKNVNNESSESSEYVPQNRNVTIAYNE